MDLENFLSSLQIRKLHRYPAVKPARTKQRRIQGFRPVGGCQNHDAVIIFEPVHLCQKLVQSLFPLVVRRQLIVPFLSHCVDFVDEHDTRGLLLRLFEQIPDLRGTHAHEHFHELGSGNGEERHIGLPGHRLRQHRLSGSRRPHQQNALRHGSADGRIPLGIVQVFHDFLQIFLRLILSGHITEVNAFRGGHIQLRIGFPHAEHHGSRSAAGPVHHFLGHPPAQPGEDQERKEEHQQIHNDIGDSAVLLNVVGEPGAGGIQTVCEILVLHLPRLVNLLLLISHEIRCGGRTAAARILLQGEQDSVGLYLHPVDLLLFRPFHKGAVVHLFQLRSVEIRYRKQIDQQQRYDYDYVVHKHGLARISDLFHSQSSMCLPGPARPFPNDCYVYYLTIIT